LDKNLVIFEKVYKLKNYLILGDNMGEIIKTKVSGDKIIYKIALSEQEAWQLKNHVTNVHLFAADLCTHDSKMIERGNKGGAKYFSIPLSLKSRRRKRYSKVSYQKIENEKKVFFVCVVDKDPLFL
jgi:hypothetical protein